MASLEIQGYQDRQTLCGILAANGYPVVQHRGNGMPGAPGIWEVLVYEKPGIPGDTEAGA
jgi:hypothetical protein